MLRLPDERRQIYFGGKKKPNIQKFLHDCQTMKVNRQLRDYERLQYLYRLYHKIEIRRKFEDWHKYVQVKQIQRKHSFKYYLHYWRKAAIFQRYAHFINQLHNPNVFLRQYIAHWHMTTLYLRSVEFNDCILKGTAIDALKKWVRIQRRQRLQETYDTWLNYVHMCRMMNKLVISV